VTAAAGAEPYAARRERGMARWRARSRLIRRLRLILPAAMATILALLAGWVVVGGVLARMSEGRAGGDALIHMTNARFFGRDSSGRPYVIGAAEASRDDTDLKLVTLRLPTLTLDAESDQATKISADQGLYREDDRMVRLNGHVALQTADGDVFRTDRVIADTVKGVVTGPTPVSGAGPTGEITAQGFDVYDRGARVVFRGEVHSRMKRD
jgi:lipopolysaccharide export system protein LptC